MIVWKWLFYLLYITSMTQWIIEYILHEFYNLFAHLYNDFAYWKCVLKSYKLFGIIVCMLLLISFDTKPVWMINTLRPRQNGHHFSEDIFKCIFLNENVRISINISLNFAPYGPIDYKSALVQIMAWRRAGDKPLSEPMMAQFTDTCMCLLTSMS